MREPATPAVLNRRQRPHTYRCRLQMYVAVHAKRRRCPYDVRQIKRFFEPFGPGHVNAGRRRQLPKTLLRLDRPAAYSRGADVMSWSFTVQGLILIPLPATLGRRGSGEVRLPVKTGWRDSLGECLNGLRGATRSDSDLFRLMSVGWANEATGVAGWQNRWTMPRRHLGRRIRVAVAVRPMRNPSPAGPAGR